jgi:hypothetical protein
MHNHAQIRMIAQSLATLVATTNESLKDLRFLSPRRETPLWRGFVLTSHALGLSFESTLV